MGETLSLGSILFCRENLLIELPCLFIDFGIYRSSYPICSSTLRFINRVASLSPILPTNSSLLHDRLYTRLRTRQ